MNSYINEIDTKIIKRKYVGDTTHIAVAENICINYDESNIEPEEFFINNIKVDEIYNSSLGYIFVSKFKPTNDSVKIYTDFEYRYKILKSMTIKFLIVSILSKYLNLELDSFHIKRDLSYFSINNIFFENQIKKIKTTIENCINVYIKSGIDINFDVEKNEVEIPGICTIPYTNLIISNLSEINSFSIISYEITNTGTVFHLEIK